MVARERKDQLELEKKPREPGASQAVDAFPRQCRKVMTKVLYATEFAFHLR